MKPLKYFYCILSIFLTSTACDKVVTYNDNYDDGLTSYGAPVISYISPVAYPDSIITSGALNQMVIIHGENLAEVKEILFNDQSVDLTEIYAVNKQITVAIPAKEPENITNTLTVTTTKGTNTFSFEVEFPPLIITGFSHDFANAGEWVDIYGENLQIYGLTPETADIRINGEKATVESSGDSYVRVIIPEGVTDNATLTLSSEKLLFRLGEPVELTYRDRGYAIVDLGEAVFTHPATKNWATDGTNPGDPKPLLPGMNLLRLNSDVEKYSWNFILNFYTFDLSFDSDPLLSDMKVNAADYDLKYELFITEETARTNPSDNIIVALRTSKGLPEENDMIIPAESGAAFFTHGRWLTMKPADMSKYVKEDGSTILLETENYLAIAITNATGYASKIDASMTNFRFVKKINIEKTPQSQKE
jgi:hypothetical protein